MSIAFSAAIYSSPSSTSYASSSSRIFVVRSKKNKPSDSKEPGQAPPRITSNVKQNLRLLKLLKEEKSRSYKPSSSYRKKKFVKKEIPEDEDIYEDSTSKLYHTNRGQGTGVPVLLVDGYNVCGYWVKLKKHFMEGRLEVARQKLIDELATYSSLAAIKVVVVFDAMMSGLPSRRETFRGIDVVFSGDQSADTWIEKEVVALKKDGCHVWVATNDVLQQQTAYIEGASVRSCEGLISEIKHYQEELEEQLQEQRLISMQQRVLKHSLDPKVVQALRDLRQKLIENEST